MIEYIFFFIAEGEFPFLIIAMLILVILFTNRSCCGWICPIGTIQDALLAIRTKKTKKIKTVKPKAHKAWLNLKFFIVILIVIIIVPLGVTKTTNLLFYFQYKQNLGAMGQKPESYFSLSEYIFVFLPNKIKEMWNAKGVQPIFSDFWVFFIFVFYLILILVAIKIPRVYCRYFCPFAAVSSAISEYSFLKLSRSPVKCVGRAACGVCERVCPHQIRILDEPFEVFSGRGECDFCLKCRERCPYEAITIKFG